jgi:hypothetical protein
MTQAAATADVGRVDAWTFHMRRGEFAEAWEVSDRILAARAGQPCWDWPRHQQYIWNGTPLEGKRVLVRCYHGLGDTLQFIRYAPLVKSLATETIVWAQPALLPLLRTVRGIDRLEALHDGVPDFGYDVDLEIMELPHVFRTSLQTIPAEVPYLHVEPAILGAGDRRSRAPLNVGLIWAAGDWDPARNVPLESLAPLAKIEGVRLHALQRGAALRAWPAAWGPISGSDSAEETARVMRALDLVITVDSMPAHLAGALGVPVWTLLHANADWRWMLERGDSPWYPTMRLFRQTKATGWGSVIAQVARAVKAVSERRSHGHNAFP